MYQYVLTAGEVQRNLHRVLNGMKIVRHCNTDMVREDGRGNHHRLHATPCEVKGERVEQTPNHHRVHHHRVRVLRPCGISTGSEAADHGH
jgi:hypothetical protein